MKKAIAILLVLMMSFSLIACSNDDKGATGSSTEANETTQASSEAGVEANAKLDTYTSVYYEEIPVLNPYNLTNTTEMKMTANTLDGLVENTNTGKYVPALAESWEANEDFTVWTFKLKEGIIWVDHLGNATEYEVT